MHQTNLEDKHHKLVVLSSGYPNEDGTFLKHTFVQGFVNEARHYYEKVEVIALMPLKPGTKPKDYMHDNVHVHFMRYPFLPVGPLNKLKGKIAFQFCYSRLKEIFRDATHIHANFTETAGIVANLYRKKTGKDFTLTSHANRDWLLRMIAAENPLYIDTWRNAKNIIRVNKADCELMKPFNQNVHAVANGFDPSKFNQLDKSECRKKLNIPKERKVIVNVAFYEEKKNQTLLIHAIRDLRPEIRKNVTCFLIGGGAMHKQLEQEIRTADLGDHVILTGQVKHTDLNLYLNSADIFSLPSNSEGNPTVMFEAMGTGLPYVGTDAGGVPEIITSEEFGLVSPVGDLNRLTKNIEKGLTKQWNKVAILDYAEQFTWKGIFLRTRELY